MPALNFHHLRYFHAIVQAGGLTKAAQELHVSPSALSVQLQQLEHQLGHALFVREGRKLVLTEAGRIALERAEAIFEAGDELVEALKGAEGSRTRTLRVGALATLSRNFQLQFLDPLIGRPGVRISLKSGSMRELVQMLDAHQIDVLLTNTPPGRDDESAWTPHILSDQSISLIGPHRGKGKREDFKSVLSNKPIIAPTPENHIRAEFDALMVRLRLTPHIVAEVDDMAMLRLLTRAGAGYAIAPPIVMQDELQSGLLSDYGALPDLRETFYAVTPTRRFPHPLISELFSAERGLQNRRRSKDARPASRRRKRSAA